MYTRCVRRQSHTSGVRSREEIEELEEEKRLAEEERRFKENLRQKVGETCKSGRMVG